MSLIVLKIIVLRWNFLLVACLTSAIKMQLKLGRYKFEEEKKLCKNMRVVNINQLVVEEWWLTLQKGSAGKTNKQTKQAWGGQFLTATPWCTSGNQKGKERENYWGWQTGNLDWPLHWLADLMV